MTDRDKEQVDQVISEIADEGTSAERIARLERLLLNRPDLQSYYTKTTRINTLIAHELGSGLQTTQPLVFSKSLGAGDAESTSAQFCVSLANSLRQDLNSPTRMKLVAAVLATVAAAILVLAGSQYFTNDIEGLGSTAAVASPPANIEKPAPPGAGLLAEAQALLIHDARSLEMLARVTRTEGITRLLLPRLKAAGSDLEASWTLCGGNAWIEHSPSDLERGYVVALRPGCRLDLHVNTDARGRNALGVVELSQRGEMTGDTLSFNNLVGGSIDVEERRIGCIGEYTVENDGPETQYLLFTGSYLAPDAEGPGTWKQSDYAVLHDSTEFLVLGWDDSCYDGTLMRDEIDRDRDYNDVCAVIRFSGPGHTATAPAGEVTYLPDSTANQASVQDTIGYTVEVKPHEKVLMAVSSSARLQNSVRIVDAASRQVIWQQDGDPLGTHGVRYQTGRRGIYVVYNNTDMPRKYEIQARHIGESSDSTDWIESPHKVTDRGDRWLSVGFEDSFEHPELVDWNDIRVLACWFND